jgi:NADPH:quinone reductase
LEAFMQAAVGTPNGLELREVPQPRPKPSEVLVKVRAAGLNRADLGAARAASHASHGTAGSPIGLEWAGEVVEAGAEVKDIKAGDRVMGGGMGGYAEYAVSDWGRTMRIPDGMGFEQAATLPVALNTMHNALLTNGRLMTGESVLIQGASSGVGLMGLQIAKLKGARPVIGSSTNDARRQRLKEFGADLAIDTRDATWPDQVLEATGGKGVALIVDMVSGATVSAAMKATAVLGRIVNVGRLGGAKAEFDFDQHALKRIDYIGVTFRTRTIEEVREIARRMRADLWDAVTAGKLRLPIDRTFRLDEAAAAQAHMRANAHFGKIVLTM